MGIAYSKGGWVGGYNLINKFGIAGARGERLKGVDLLFRKSGDNVTVWVVGQYGLWVSFFSPMATNNSFFFLPK